MQRWDSRTAYRVYLGRVRLQNLKIAFLLEIPLMPLGGLLDFFVYPQHAWLFLFFRLICSVAIFAAFLAVCSRWKRRLLPVLSHVWYVFPCATMAGMLAVVDGAHSSYYAGFNLIIMGASVVMQSGIRESLASILIIISLYLIGCFISGEVTPKAVYVNNIYFMALTSLIVLAGNHNYNRLRFQEFNLRHSLRESRRELVRNNQQLRELDQAKSRFFANVSHELRTPLTLILGPMEKLRNLSHLSVQEGEKIVKVLETNALRLLRLINNLLELVKAGDGGSIPQLKAIPIDKLMAGLIDSVTHLAELQSVKLNARTETTSRLILSDQDRLEKIVLNLLLNAIKFTPAGGSVSLNWILSETELRIEVEDTGIGISPEDQLRLFERFWQANTSTTRKHQGFGIGLALVRELAVVLGGTVQVRSEIDRGSTFVVILPTQLVESAISENENQVTSANSHDHWLGQINRRADLFTESDKQTHSIDHIYLARRQRPLIILAEDQAGLADFIASELQEEFDTLIAPDGQYAIDMTRQYKPDLLVVDVMMPEKDGLEVCRELRDEVQARGLPILVLTAHISDALRIEALNLGATDFMTKPFSIAELKARSRNLVALTLLNQRIYSQNQELQRQMEQIEESETKMVQHAKAISLGRMSAGLIHEINNPLNFTMAAASQLRRQIPDVGQEYLDDIDQGLKRVSMLVTDLRTFAYPNPQEFVVIDLSDSIRKACRLTSSLEERAILPSFKIDSGLRLFGNPNQLSQVWINLVQNAIDALVDAGEVVSDPQITVSAAKADGRVVVKVADNGPGISSDLVEKIFDPFFTTKTVGRGMGLGLSICRTIVRAHGGNIEVETDSTTGTLFNVSLPALNERQIYE